MSAVNERDAMSVQRSLLPWLQEKLPGAARVELPEPTKPEVGGSSETFLLNPTVLVDGTQRQEQWVLRVQASGYQVYRDPSVERQFRILEVLGDTGGGVRVPRTLWYEGNPEVIGAPFFIMQRARGEAPPNLHHSHGVLARATPAQRETMWLDAMAQLAAVHRVADERLQFLARPEYGSTGFDQELAYWHAYLTWSGIAVRAEHERAFKWMHDHLPQMRGTGLAWGDARPGNLLFSDDQVQAVIDWETASLGGAETDLGWWLFFEWFATDCADVAPMEGWGNARQTLRAWEHLAGRQLASMEWHEVFATLRFSMIFDRARLLAVRRGQPELVSQATGQRIAQRLDRIIAST